MVYPDFLEESMMVEPFEIDSGETIYVGQDLNDGFNKVVCCVIRDESLYVINTMSVPNIGDVPTILRNTYPTQAIFYFPDSAGQSRTIMNAYINELRINNIQLRMGNINPNIVERVFIINKLFKLARLFLFKGCESLAIALKTRCYDKIGKPEKGKDENSPDHFCLIGDTKIMTNKGEKKIKDIKINDFVLTRKGFRKVIDSQCTGIKEVFEYNLNGHKIIATSDHKILTKEDKKEISLLTRKDICCTISNWRLFICNKLFSMESFLEGILNQKDEQIAYIIKQMGLAVKKGSDIYIKKYGKGNTGKYLKDFVFTIKTEIRLIMRLKILLLWKGNYIIVNILKNIIKNIQKLSKRILIKQEWKQLNGIKAMKVENGIENMLKKILQLMKKLMLNVNVVAKNLKVNISPNFALENVSQNIEEIPISIMKQGNVNIAEENSLLINTLKQHIAQRVVEENITGKQKGFQLVYNLTIEDEHEYYANGILVSNCDSLEYVVFRVVNSILEFIEFMRTVGRKSA